MLRGHIRFYEKGGHINSGGGSLDWKSDVLVPFLRLKVTRGSHKPPPPPYVVFSKNTSGKNFEIAICSEVVQRLYNKAFGVDRISQSLGIRVASYAPGA